VAPPRTFTLDAPEIPEMHSKTAVPLRCSLLVFLTLLCPRALAGDPTSAVESPAPATGSAEAGGRWIPAGGTAWSAAEGDVSVELFGRLQNDWAFNSSGPGMEDGTEFRRARLGVKGTLYENVFFKVQYDFAGGDADFMDTYLGFTDVVGEADVKVGHFKEPFSLEELTSSKYLTFLERSLPNALSPGRNTGVGISDASGDVTWSLGMFRTSGSDGDDVGGPSQEYSATARVTFTPVYADGGDEVLHLGLAYSDRSADDGVVSFATGPENHQAPDVVDTGDIIADGYGLLGLEGAWVHGPLSLQAELIQASVDAADGSEPEFVGHYFYAGWFVTDGDRRNYDRRSAAFGRVKPEANYGTEGNGALELTARLSALDLDGAGVPGGKLDDFTLGVNWYLNPNTRVMLNYVTGDEGGIDREAVLARFQIDF
jgi:phosphate-selective porin OprO/OprP